MKLLLRICALTLALAAAALPAFSQGLIGLYPEGFSSWEEYMQHQRQEAERTERDGKLWEFLYNSGAGFVFPDINHVYGESLMRQAMAWEFARDVSKVERCYKIAVRVETDRYSLKTDMDYYASLLRGQDRYSEQKVWLQKVVAFDEEDYGTNSPRRCFSLRELARCYGQLKETANQIDTLKLCLKLLKHARETEDDDYHYDDESDIAGDLARALEAGGDLAGAERNYKLAFAVLKPGYAGIWSRLPCADELGEFYLRRGSPEKAEPVFKSSLAMWRQDRHYDSRGCAERALNAYLRILLRTHRAKEAAEVKAELAKIAAMDRW